MALRMLHRKVLAKPLFTYSKFFSQAQADPASPEKSPEKPDATLQPDIVEDDLDKEVYPPVISENNPLNHNTSHIGYLYRVPEAVKKKVFAFGGFPRDYLKQASVFQDTCIMVRQPALEIINNLKNTDYSRPALRQVLYGKYGCGKTMTLAHVTHYGHKENYLLVHVPWTNTFTRRAKQVKPSNFVEGALDVPLDGSMWLDHFKTQNIDFLNNPDFVTSNHYQWNDHECTEKGRPMVEMIDYGKERSLYSNVVIDSLLREIKAYTTAGLLKTLVIIDGFNGFYAPYLKSSRIIHPGKLALAQSFLNITKFDWCNASIVLTVDRMDYPLDGKELYKPYELLGKEGWEHLDPFVPIEVVKYSYIEAQNMLDYFIQKKWLVNPAALTPEGRDELITLSSYNPRALMRLCDPL